VFTSTLIQPREAEGQQKFSDESAVEKQYKILGFNVSGWKTGAKEWLLR
jgi:hypothetical protein